LIQNLDGYFSMLFLLELDKLNSDGHSLVTLRLPLYSWLSLAGMTIKQDSGTP
jgi:hypothetical protein